MKTKTPTTKPETPAGLSSSVLLACPFCGSKANGPEDVSVPPKTGTWWQIMCSDEKGTDCCAWRAGATPELVTAKWNMRTNPYQDAYLQVVKDLQYTVERLKEETGEKWKLKHALEQANAEVSHTAGRKPETEGMK